MNIQNLNQNELEQLQILLNKMNPTQPQPKLYLDPVNKMIDDIMNEFDFNKVQEFTKNPKAAIVNALERGNFGTEDNFIRIEGSEYDDGTGDFNFTIILENRFKFDG